MPTRSLVREHLLIEQVLNCLERMLERCNAQHVLEATPAYQAIEFLRGFAERCHRVREERELLPKMESLGISAEQCLGCSLHHRRHEARRHVEALGATVEPAAEGDQEAIDRFTEHAEAYIELLTDYMARQEDCLFPMIERDLPAKAKRRLISLEDATERSEGGTEAFDTYLDIANRLADHFDVPRSVMEEAPAQRTFPEQPRDVHPR